MNNPKTTTPLACVILAAGRGSRMKSSLPKVQHAVAGRPLISWVLAAVTPLQPERIICVLAPEMEELAAALRPHATIAIQGEPRGTGDAVRAALPALKNFLGDVLIVMGDMPLLSTATLAGLIAERQRRGVGVTVLGAMMDQPDGFGRLILAGFDGPLTRIVEHKDATPEERAVHYCNLGAYCVDGAAMAGWLGALKNDNAQGEYYLTDMVQIAHGNGAGARAHLTKDAAEAMGVNSRGDLAVLEQAVQKGLRARALAAGVTMIDPASVHLSWDTAFGQDVMIEPHVFFGPGVTVAEHAHIRAFSHIEGAAIAADATIGPHARLRPGAQIGPGARVGNFVEVKNATLGPGVKANHLAYIGDATVGAHTNIGCGAITVNYDGVNKHKTVIGENVMVGSNVSLVAPITIGDNAYLAAGSTITKNVPADALAVARGRQSVHEGWAKKKE